MTQAPLSNPPADAMGNASTWMPGIEIMRGLAALAVVFFHLNEPIPMVPSMYRIICKQGWLGVAIFFVISGYVIAMTASRIREPSVFLLRRMARVFPAYWASLGIVLCVAIFRWKFAGANDVTAFPRTPIDLLGTIILAIEPVSRIKPINWVYWSLVCEVCYYLLVYISKLLHLDSQLPAVLSVAILVCASLHVDLNPVLHWWPLFGLGYALHDPRAPGSVVSIASNTITILLAFQGAVILTTILVIGFLLVSSRSTRILEPTAEKQNLHGTRKPPLALVRRFGLVLGKVSYSLYLIHVPIGVYILSPLRPTSWIGHPVLHVTSDCGIAIFLVGLAYLSFQIVEAPAIQWSRAWRARAC